MNTEHLLRHALVMLENAQVSMGLAEPRHQLCDEIRSTLSGTSTLDTDHLLERTVCMLESPFVSIGEVWERYEIGGDIVNVLPKEKAIHEAGRPARTVLFPNARQALGKLLKRGR